MLFEYFLFAYVATYQLCAHHCVCTAVTKVQYTVTENGPTFETQLTLCEKRYSIDTGFAMTRSTH